MTTVYLNAENCIAGRTASLAAKELLKGKKVMIVNAEKAVVSGNPKYTIALHQERIKRGDPYHGPFAPRSPDRIIKRMVRGMLPYKKPLGRISFHNLRVYLDVPEEMKDQTFASAKKAEEGKKGILLEAVSRRLT